MHMLPDGGGDDQCDDDLVKPSVAGDGVAREAKLVLGTEAVERHPHQSAAVVLRARRAGRVVRRVGHYLGFRRDHRNRVRRLGPALLLAARRLRSLGLVALAPTLLALALLALTLLLIIFVVREGFEQDGDEEVHDDEEAHHDGGHEEEQRREHRGHADARLEEVDPAAREDAEDGEHGRVEVVEVPARVGGHAGAAEGLHAEQREDEHEQEHEDEEVADLRHRLAEAHDDVVEARPRLEQPQQPQQPQHAQEGDVDARVGEQHGDRDLDHRHGHDGAVELVPRVGPVRHPAHAQQLEAHLDDEHVRDAVAHRLGECRPPRRLPHVRHAHHAQVEHHQRRRHVANRIRVHEAAERRNQPAARRAAAVCGAVAAAAGVSGQEPGFSPLVRAHRVGLAAVRCFLNGARLQRFLGGVGLLRAHELVEDGGQEEIDEEEAAQHRHRHKVDARPRRVRTHHGDHRVGPRVEGDRLQDGDHRHQRRVEGRRRLGVGAEVVADHPVRLAHARIGMAQYSRVEPRQVLAAAATTAAAAAAQRAVPGLREGEQCGVDASLPQHATEEVHADDAEDEEDEGREHRDVEQRGHRLEDGGDQHRHAGHALEGPQRAQRAHAADGGHVAHGGEEDRQPRERDHDEVELAPRVAQVAGGRCEQAVGEHLGGHLEGEDEEVDPLEYGEHDLLPRAARVEGRGPGHRAAVGHDGDQDERVEEGRLDQLDEVLARLLVRQEAIEGAPLVDPAARAEVRLARLPRIERR
eukprot:scaffold11064_cov63-Phaeocystis_antarctica.AAC.2